MDQRSFGVLGQGDALWEWNLISDRIHFSPGWRSLIGCDEHQVGNTPETLFQRIHPEDLGAVKRVIESAVAAGPDEFELRHRMLHEDGSYRWVSCRGIIRWNAEGEAVRVSACHSDVTAQAGSDPLTGLPNRLLLIERLTQSIGRAARYPGFHFAVLSIELTRPGHGEKSLTGADPLLNAVARRLETCLRAREAHPTLRNNDLVARLDGDQFVALLDGLKDLGHAAVAADRILAEVVAPYRMGPRETRISASLGIALSATKYERADDALRDADTALHRAKLLGGNRCEVFDTGALRSVQAELQLESDFSGAIERDEFVLFYQPIVSLSSNQILGFEGLARWQHPVLGLIPPLEFVPLAEKTGFIIPLGKWVLREACRQVKEWQGGLPGAGDLWVSVNLSSAHLNHATLVGDIGDALRDTGLEPRCLVLEVTESQAMENPAAVQTVLMKVRAGGVRVSLDDFGTGHSALAYLRQLPLDMLKIDRSFVRGIEANRDMKSIFGAVSAMTADLGLQVVAEGIEKIEQLELVRSLGCDSGQGYLFSKPVDGASAAALLKTGLTPLAQQRARRAQPVPNGRPQRTMKGLYAAAAVLAVVASVGLPRVLGGPPLPPLPTAPLQVVPYAAAAQAVPLPSNDTTAVTTGQTAVTPGQDAVTPGRNAERIASAPVAPPSTTATESATPAVPPIPAKGIASAISAATAATVATSVSVVHQHRLGNCRGQLVVSAAGVSYVPGDPGDGKDAFSLGHHQFLHELDGDSLTIRSTEKAYRFKVGEATGGMGDHLARLVESITRFRVAAPSASRNK